MYYCLGIVCGLLFINEVISEPICTTYNAKDIVCNAGNEDYVLKRGLVSDNNKTTGITLRGCRITGMELESFNGLFSLEYIDLSQNKIRNFELGVFDDGEKVTYLNLSYNLISEFPLGLFDLKPNLRILDLKGNRLVTLELGIFDPLKELKFLDLSSNKILGKDWNAYIFDQSPEITFMDFSRNNMDSAPDNMLNSFHALDFLNLDRCLLKEVPHFVTSASNLSTLKHLMMSNNQVRKLTDPLVFNHLINLEKINFSDNVIDELHEGVFSALNKLELVILRNNKLVSIPDKLFTNLKKLWKVDLHNNRLEFIPVNAFRGTSVKILNLAHNRFTYLQDNFYLELKNSGVGVTKFYFNDNPWQCACLVDFLKEMKTYKVEYNSVKYNGKVPVCVNGDQFICKRHLSDNEYFTELYYEQLKIKKTNTKSVTNK